MIDINFQYAYQVSHYITKHHLGKEYPHICGPVDFKYSGRLEDGFPPRIYSLLCRVLNITDGGSGDKVVGYKTHAELKDY